MDFATDTDTVVADVRVDARVKSLGWLVSAKVYN